MGWEDVQRRGRDGKPVPQPQPRSYDPEARWRPPAQAAVAPVAPVPVAGVDYVAIQKQADAQIAASNQQMALMQQQAVNQETQFKSLLGLEQQRIATLQTAATQQNNLFNALKVEQDNALRLQEQRLARSQVQAREQQRGLFQLGSRTVNSSQARATVRRTQVGSRANVFRS